MVWKRRVNPIAKGCFICKNKIPMIKAVIVKIKAKISRGSLFKILILGINDKEFLFSWSFKRGFLLLIYKTRVFIKLLKLMLTVIGWIFNLLIFLPGVFAFISYRKHLLSIILSLEYIVLRIYLTLFYCLRLFNGELYFSVIFLTFRVCEGALGLSILVSLVRSHGNDYYQSFSVLQC